MKKYLSLLLAFITIFSMGYIPAAADSTTFGVTYVASVSEVKPGDEFTVEAVFNGIENATGFSITIDVANIKGNVYSTSKPTYISGEEAFVKNAPDNNNFAAMYESAVTLTGSYLRFSFKVDETNTESNIVIPFTTKITRPGEEGSKPVASENLVLTQKCNHALSFVAEVPSTCAVQGTKAHYACSKCGALFADAGGTIATTAEALRLPLDPNNHGDGLSSTGWTAKDGENHAQTCKKCNREITEAHKWDKGVVTTPATHTAEGVLTYTCEICKATRTETIEKIPEHSFGPWTKRDGDIDYHYRTCACGNEQKEMHKWNDGVITVKPTHTEKGKKLFTCTVCDATKTVDVPALTEHSFGDWSKLDDEYHHRFCVCGVEQKEMHKWNDGVITVKPTHTEKGKKLFTCTVCDATKTVDVPTLTEHSFGDWSKLDDEYHHRFCVCGTEQKEMHKWDKGVITVKPTHTEKGKKLFTCTVCDATKTVDVPALTEHSFGDWSKLDDEYHHRFCVCGVEQKEMHKWNDGVITVKPTHTEKGKKLFTCTVCDATKTVDVPPLTDHAYGPWTKREGDIEFHYRTCVCGNEQKEAHKWDEGVITVVPTVFKDGTRTFTCTVCGAKKDVAEPYHVHDYDKNFNSVKWSTNASYHWKRCACGEIAYKGAHVSSDWIVDGYPNPVSIGMMHKECVICGYILAREILPATGSIIRPTQTRQYTVTATAGNHGSISHAGKTVVKSGDNITYVITPDEGYEIASVLVNGADIGAVREYTFWNVRSDCTISVSFREIPAAHYNPFIDVSPADAYYDAVLYVYENGLFKGVSETEFAPDTTMTRAMFVTVLGRMAGVNPLLYQKSSFTDVEMGQWYSPYVEWAAKSGIVLGYGDGTFGLNDDITVEQAAVILTRYAAFTGRSTYTLRTLHDFADAADVSDWAVYSMKWIVSSGIYTGENGMLSPKSLAKRSLVAAMLYNYAG